MSHSANWKDGDVFAVTMSGAAATATAMRSARIEAATGRDGREIFSWQAALLSQRRN